MSIFSKMKVRERQRRMKWNRSRDSGPPVLKNEVKWAVEWMKCGNAAGPGWNLHRPVPTLRGNRNTSPYLILFNIDKAGSLPDDMLKSIFSALPKKPNMIECNQHRRISLMSHVLKLLLEIVLQRIRSKISREIPTVQFRFMEDRGTHHAIFVLHIISERSIQVNKISVSALQTIEKPLIGFAIDSFFGCWSRYWRQGPEQRTGLQIDRGLAGAFVRAAWCSPTCSVSIVRLF